MKVTLNDGRDDFDRGLKLFTKMVKKSELLQELRNREYYRKPSKKRAFKREEALRRRKRDEKKELRHNKFS